MLYYFVALIAVIGGLVAAMGNTWDGSKTGWPKFTTTGWVSVMAIAIGGVLSLLTVYESEKTKAQISNYREELAPIIRYEINKSVDSLLSPFQSLYLDYTGYQQDSDWSFEDSKISVEVLLRPENLQKAESVCLEASPKNTVFLPSSRNIWTVIFSEGISAGVHRLERLQLMYAAYMDPDLLQKIQLLLEEGSMTHFARRNTETVAKDGLSLPFCSISRTGDRHKTFLHMIKEISDAGNNAVLSPSPF